MHILLIHQAFASLDEPGGTRHHELANHLASRGHCVTIIASPVSYLTGSRTVPARAPVAASLPLLAGEGNAAERPGTVRILRASAYAAHHRSFLHRLLAFVSFAVSSFFSGLRVRKVDIVWGTSPPIFQGVTAWLLAKIKGVPFLFEVRDLWPQFAVGVGVLKNRIIIRLSEGLERFLYRHADRVLVNSPGYIGHVRQRGAKQVELIPNGVDTGMFDPGADGKAFRSLHGLEGRFVVLYAGAHGLSNDLGVVLQTARLLEGKSSIRFVLLGDGKEKASLQRQASEMGLENVLFLPPVPKSQVPGILAAADACIAILMPIEAYRTTYPNKVFDYMAAGRPVVLAIDGVIRQVVEQAGCGVFVQPGDPSALAGAILDLEKHRKDARRMGVAGRKAVLRQFSREIIAADLLRVLEKMQAAGR